MHGSPPEMLSSPLMNGRVPGSGHVAAQIEAAGVVAVIRLQDPGKLRSVVSALMDGGVRALEVTMTVPRAIEMIAELAPAIPEEFLLGAGTVLDADTARRAVRAGARFVVSPVCRPEIVGASHELGAAALPGCFTPTEILTAWESGADIVKVFPATALGPEFLKDIHGPLPHVKLLPTGGVTLQNAGQWIKAGAVAVGIGSALVDRQAIAAGDYRLITANARCVVASVAAARVGRGGNP